MSTKLNSLGLNNLFVLITNKCNLECKHCYVSSSPKGVFGISNENIVEIAKQFHNIFGRQIITLSGGEVFMRKNLSNLVNDLVKFHNVFILTNGTLINEKTLSGFPLKSIAFRIGIDGISAITHDFIRGKGNYKKAIRGYEELRKYGFSENQIEIFYTAVPENLNDIKTIPFLAKELSIKRMIIEPVAIHGRASTFWDKTQVNGLDKFRNEFYSTIKETFDNTNWHYKKTEHNFKSLTIYSNGNVYPYTFVDEFDKKNGLLGNIFHETLEQIIDVDSYKNKILLKTMNYLKNCGNTTSSLRIYEQNLSEYVEFK